MEKPKIIADSMLGRLVRYLRLSGYDVLYMRCSDEEILGTAERLSRVLITRDKELFEKAINKGIKAIYVKSQEIDDQIAELINKGFKFNKTPAEARCPICNSDVEPIEKEKVKGRVPERVYNYIDEFWICKKCGKIYWHGGHWKSIKETIENAERKAVGSYG